MLKYKRSNGIIMSVKKVILIGSGVRETYLAKRLFIDTNGQIAITIILTKRNPEISCYAKNIFLINDFTLETFLSNKNVESFINKNFKEIDFAVIGPEMPLQQGFADFFESIGIKTVGPKMNLAKLETSKLFCREFLRVNNLSKLSPNWCDIKGMEKEKVCSVFSNLSSKYGNIVVKKTGLCGGKGVKVQGVDFQEYSEVEEFIFNGEDTAGDIIFEERLLGKEFSMMSLYNPNGVLYHLPPVKDYKRRYNGNSGPNTGSMGALVDKNNTLDFLSLEDLNLVKSYNKQILSHLHGYRGVFYGSYIKTNGVIKLIEVNCRFGDPEGVLALELFTGNLYDLFSSICSNSIDRIPLEFSTKAALGIYMVPKEYAVETADIGESGGSLRNVIYFTGDYDRHMDNMIMGDVRFNGETYFTGTSRTLFVYAIEDTVSNCINKVNSLTKYVNGTLDYRTDIGNEFIQDAYESCGVSVDRASQALALIKSDIMSTYNKNVTSEYGSFSGEYKLGDETLLASIDGVGTKSKFVTDMLGEEGYLTLGMDIINHSINDILVQGGRPLFFLDYFGTGHLNAIELRNFVCGIANECKKHDVVLIGGETAEMPGFYKHKGSSELVGCIVGVKDKRFQALNKNIVRGDVLVYLDSSGPHTNGYSFIRNLNLSEHIVAEVPELLAPHRCYYKDIMDMLDTYGNGFIKGMCHITGGGLFDNLKRIIPEDLFESMEIKINDIELPIWSEFLLDCSEITKKELLNIFNCGIGYVLIISPEDYARVIEDENNELTYLGKL